MTATIKKIIKHIFNILGFEIRRLPSIQSNFEPTRIKMKESLQHILSLNYYPKIIIDVGAGYGTWPLLKVFPKSRFLWIEPLIEFENALKKLSEKYNGQFVIAAAGKFDGTIPIKVAPYLFGGSLRYDKSDKSLLREIKVVRLDSLIDKYDFRDDILLKVDVEGYELEVLEGAQELLQGCEIVILEVSLFNYTKEHPDFYEVIDYMKKRKFVVYDIFGGHNRPLDKALAQKDILFVKENGRFRQSHNWSANNGLGKFSKKFKYKPNSDDGE